LVSRLLEDRNESLGLGLDTKSLGLGLDQKGLALVLVLPKKSWKFSRLFSKTKINK
jgi:hypothetical protein